MRIFLWAALVLFVLALIVAAGGTLVTTWPVWMLAGFVAFMLDALLGGYIVVNRPPPA